MCDDYAIVTDGLTKHYGSVTAVHGLNLMIPHGAIFGFLGPNGSGKTTTIRMLLGLTQPTSGRALILGRDVQERRREANSRVGAVIETPTFYTYLTGRQNLQVFAHSANLKADPALLDRLLHQVNLYQWGDAKVKIYSLGMKQRLGIAATLLTAPQVIFLDEPTNGLDPQGQAEIRTLIAGLGQQGHTIFLSSHMLHEVEQICTDVAILQNGSVQMQGKVRDLLAEGNQFGVQATPQAKALDILKQQAGVEAKRQDDHWITIFSAEGDISRLIQLLVGAGVSVHQVQKRRQSLEQLFLTITNQQNSSTALNTPVKENVIL